MVEIAGDELTLGQAVAAVGVPGALGELPVSALVDPDQEAMFRWLGRQRG